MMQKPGDRDKNPIDAIEQMEGLFRSHYDAVLAYVRRRSPAERADDVVAETFLTAWRRLEHIPSESLPWLLGVARNVIGTQQRGARRRDALHLRLRGSAGETVPQPSVHEPGPLAAALRSLSERDREALTLIAWDGLQPSQAAAVVGESPSTFRVRLHRAKRRLRRSLEQHQEQTKLPASCRLEATPKESP